MIIAIDTVPVLAVEFKSRSNADMNDTRGLQSFREDYPDVFCIVVCMASESFLLGNVTVLPWRRFLELTEAL